MSSDTESLSPSNFSNEEDEATQSVQSRRALSIDLADHDLLEIIKADQLEKQQLATQNKSLQIRVDALEVRSRKSGTKQTAAKVPKNGLETDIKRAGGRFSVVGELWVSEATLDIAMPNPESVDLFDRKRYDDRRTEACAIIAEIYLDLKTDLRLILADPMQRVLFKTHFVPQLNQERSNAVHRAREQAHLILNLPAKCFEDRANDPELRRLLENPQYPDQPYPMLPRLLYPDFDPEGPGKLHPFQSEPLAEFLKIFLYGPRSNGKEKHTSKPTRGMLWRLERSTPGMIAMAATIVVFICTPDTIFSEKGKGPSGILWGERFRQYKRTLLRFPVDNRNQLLSWFDTRLFRRTGSSMCAESFNENLEEVDDLVERLFQAGVTHLDPPSAQDSDATQLPMPLAVDQDLDQDSEPVKEPVAHDNELELEQPVEHRLRSKRKGKKSTASTGKTRK